MYHKEEFFFHFENEYMSYMYVCACVSKHVEVRGEFTEIRSLLPLWRLHGSNSGHQAGQVPLCAEPAHQPELL